MTPTSVTDVIGIDCATDPKKVGLARGTVSGSELTLKSVSLGSQGRSVAEVVATWIAGSHRTLIALDAPLGWPLAMGRDLAKHQAGQVISSTPDDMFRRLTDRTLKARIGKQLLEVGADRIARTAHAALKLIHELRGILSLPIPLARSDRFTEKVAAIEVYPAGTLTAYEFRAAGYKEWDRVAERREIIGQLSTQMRISGKARWSMAENADVLDAAVCLLAARDFLVGDVIEPENLEIAAKEGWIWVRARDRKNT